MLQKFVAPAPEQKNGQTAVEITETEVVKSDYANDTHAQDEDEDLKVNIFLHFFVKQSTLSFFFRV